MTHFLRPSSLSSWGWPGKLGGRTSLSLLLLTAGLSGCLPAKTPADAPLTGEPSEAEILRADNAELAKRVQELRAEKAELKRQVALLELKVSSTGPDGSVLAEAATAGAAAAAPTPALPESPLAAEVAPSSSHSVATTPPSQASASAPRAPAEAPVLISGSAEAADFDRGRDALEAGAYLSADQTLTRFLVLNPRHPFADDALVLRGRARVGRQQFDAAERDFRQVADRYPEELVAPDAWLELVRLCQTRGDDPGARQASRTLLDRYPDSAAASLVPSEFLE